MGKGREGWESADGELYITPLCMDVWTSPSTLVQSVSAHQSSQSDLRVEVENNSKKCHREWNRSYLWLERQYNFNLSSNPGMFAHHIVEIRGLFTRIGNHILQLYAAEDNSNTIAVGHQQNITFTVS